MTKLSIILISAVFLGSGCFHSHPMATIGSARINLEIADSSHERNQGLSGREGMLDNFGMLFEFETEGLHSFWMKDMKFPLDFIWIRQGKVVEITPNVQPQMGIGEGDLKIHSPSQPIDSMIEVNAGWASKNGIKVGDSVSVD